MGPGNQNEFLKFTLPIEEVSADINYAQYLNESKSIDRFEELFSNAPTVKKRPKGIQNLTSLEFGIFGLEEGNSMLNALKVNTDVTTAALLRVHVLRVLQAIWLFIHIKIILWLEILDGIRELVCQFVHMLCWEAEAKAKKLTYSVKLFNHIPNFVNYHYKIIERFPAVLYLFLSRNLICYSPWGFKEFKDSFPMVENSFLPQSTALLLKINDNMLPYPPDIPKPYLDSDKELRVPSKKEYLHILSLRNEYFTQSRAHIAAEKVRMLSEIGRFITWNSLLSHINFVDIFETYGCLWDGDQLEVEGKLEILGTSILNELNAFTSTCSEDELNELKDIIPEIILFDIATGTEHVVNGSIKEDPDYEEEFVDSLIGSASNTRVLKVYLCDKRLREELVLSYIAGTLGNQVSERGVSELLPITPDLIVVTGKSCNSPLQTYGFACSEESNTLFKSPLIYYKQSRFGFNQFSKSIFEYVLDLHLQTSLRTEIPLKSSAASPIENPQDKVNYNLTN